MKIILSILSLLFLFGCELADLEFELPEGNNATGAYDYNSTSIYYDVNNIQEATSTNRGIIDYNSSTDTGSIEVTPIQGWSYTIDIINLTDHTLTNGDITKSFTIRQQQKTVNAEDFTFEGVKSVELLDSDGGTLLGTYDGTILADGFLEFEFSSLNRETSESVNTKVKAEVAD